MLIISKRFEDKHCEEDGLVDSEVKNINLSVQFWYQYKRKTWKGKMIKNILIGRQTVRSECERTAFYSQDTYNNLCNVVGTYFTLQNHNLIRGLPHHEALSWTNALFKMTVTMPYTCMSTDK